MDVNNPILNGPYDEPALHYATDLEGALDYETIVKGRRVFRPEMQAMPKRQSGQRQIFAQEDVSDQYAELLVNLCRTEVGKWRAAQYPGTTRVTRELLLFWFENPERIAAKRLFFAQREAVETAIWLNEVADRSNPGQHILNRLKVAQQGVSPQREDQLPRVAFKMATGSGKTVVMACLILYHYFNRQEYRNDTRFADYFLVVAPGVTIRDRLAVLYVDTQRTAGQLAQDYYRERGLVPRSLDARLEGINARLVITNYHAFEPKTLQGNKRSPFDGKVDVHGNKVDTDNLEDYGLVLKRLMGKFKRDSRVLVLNDEAHHCYLPKGKEKTTDNEDEDENVRAAVWFTGLREVAKRYKLQQVYDLSATPYYLQGSGYDAYSLFPWVVSDFGLTEAIEAGLVKIPFIPESDNTQELSMPVLRDLYTYVKDELPKKGQRKQKSEAAAEGGQLKEAPPRLPSLVLTALDSFYTHYADYSNGMRSAAEAQANLFSAPPVFILVCNNTSVSKEVYKYLAGYQYTDEQGELRTVSGAKDMFSNFDPATGNALRRPPTLLIDSAALENGDQVSDEFKKIFGPEIEHFKRDFVRTHGQGSAERITDAEILREVVNTVGKPGKLGGHIRCVVSVSMLTEGWDANTVTHVMGIRKFGSSLLCEQVAGRALRRMSYALQGYDKDGLPTDDKRKVVVEKFPPEYAHIIGVPFKVFKGGKTGPIAPQPLQQRIKALPERQQAYEIRFPNVVGYRMEYADEGISFDYSGVEDYQLDGSKIPTETVLASPISSEEQMLSLEEALEKRDQELIFLLTKALLRYHFSDEEGQPKFQKFARLKEAVATWYASKVKVLNYADPRYKRLLFFENPKTLADHIARGINTHLNDAQHLRPMLNYYNPEGSTRYVQGMTTKEIWPTTKSHVNAVVADSDWEAIAAKTFEELPEVLAYVKNQFLGFSIPYTKDGRDREYYPDFLVRHTGTGGREHITIVEITGMNKEKAEKKWYVEQRWLPAVNALSGADGPLWRFIEIATDIRDIRSQIQTYIANC